jgi:hypothetical protein
MTRDSRSCQPSEATKPILFLSGESSAYRGLSPSLLTCPNDFTHIVSRSYLPQRPILQGRMLRHELNGMIHIPRLKHANATELLLGFRIGTVGRRDFPVPPIQGQRVFRRLKTLSAGRVLVGAQVVVVLKAFVEHCVSLFLGHSREFCRIVVSHADVFHCSSPPGRASGTALANVAVTVSSNEGQQILI